MDLAHCVELVCCWPCDSTNLCWLSNLYRRQSVYLLEGYLWSKKGYPWEKEGKEGNIDFVTAMSDKDNGGCWKPLVGKPVDGRDKRNILLIIHSKQWYFWRNAWYEPTPIHNMEYLHCVNKRNLPPIKRELDVYSSAHRSRGRLRPEQ